MGGYLIGPQLIKIKKLQITTNSLSKLYLKKTKNIKLV